MWRENMNVGAGNNPSGRDDQQCSFGIKKIVDCKIVEGGKQMYKVKWEATWEPAENLTSCQHLIDEFWSFVNKAKSNEEVAQQHRKRARLDSATSNGNTPGYNQQHLLSEDSKEEVQRLIARTNATQVGNPPSNIMTPSDMLNNPQHHMQQNQINMPRTPTRTNNPQMFPQQHSPFSSNMRHQSPGMPPSSPGQFNQPGFGSPQQFGSPMSHSPSQRGKPAGMGNKVGVKHEDEGKKVTVSANNMFDDWDNPYVTVRFHCRICDKELPNKNYWKTHNGLHSNSFKCNECGKVFGTSSNLRRHEKIHQKFKPEPQPNAFVMKEEQIDSLNFGQMPNYPTNGF